VLIVQAVDVQIIAVPLSHIVLAVEARDISLARTIARARAQGR